MATKKKKESTASTAPVAIAANSSGKDYLWIVAGCYEAALFGFRVDLKQSPIDFEPVFMHASAHTGSIKNVAIQPTGSVFASGGSDDMIKLFSLSKLIELGSLMHHRGSVTKLEFYNDSHMLSGSDDGTIAIWRTKDWESLMALKGHKGSVNDLSVHPSGRVALSVGKDKNLKLWNLITGKSAHTTKLGFEPSFVAWSPSGECYALSYQSTLTLYASSGDILASMSASQTIHAIAYITDELIASAGEDKTISLWDNKGNLIKEVKQHETRIRTLAVAKHPRETESSKFLISGSSDGMLILWRLHKSNQPEKLEIEEVARNNTQARLTSVSMIGLHEEEKKKRKKKKKKQQQQEKKGKQESDNDSEVDSEDDDEPKGEKVKKAKKAHFKK